MLLINNSDVNLFLGFFGWGSENVNQISSISFLEKNLFIKSILVLRNRTLSKFSSFANLAPFHILAPFISIPIKLIRWSGSTLCIPVLGHAYFSAGMTVWRSKLDESSSRLAVMVMSRPWHGVWWRRVCTTLWRASTPLHSGAFRLHMQPLQPVDGATFEESPWCYRDWYLRLMGEWMMHMTALFSLHRAVKGTVWSTNRSWLLF